MMSARGWTGSHHLCEAMLEVEEGPPGGLPSTKSAYFEDHVGTPNPLNLILSLDRQEISAITAGWLSASKRSSNCRQGWLAAMSCKISFA